MHNFKNDDSIIVKRNKEMLKLILKIKCNYKLNPLFLIRR